ncbi:MAG: metalloregulator ArsR/SmtB family transcription factor [Bryobacteraceae bacterium]|nr:metalloregulator ArsR/SmtB family transcription factor [Bryobacteraceae bacterium]
MRHRPQVERQLKALADATRLRILNLLRQGEICGRDLGYVLRLSQPNIAQHLAYLRHAGVVRGHRKGSRVFYRLAERPGRVLSGLLESLRAAFEREQVFTADTRRLKKAVLDGVFALGGIPRAAKTKSQIPGSNAGQEPGTSEYGGELRLPRSTGGGARSVLLLRDREGLRRKRLEVDLACGLPESC